MDWSARWFLAAVQTWPDEQYELFQQLGIQHLLAVSGMHLRFSPECSLFF